MIIYFDTDTYLGNGRCVVYFSFGFDQTPAILLVRVVSKQFVRFKQIMIKMYHSNGYPI